MALVLFAASQAAAQQEHPPFGAERNAQRMRQAQQQFLDQQAAAEAARKYFREQTEIYRVALVENGLRQIAIAIKSPPESTYFVLKLYSRSVSYHGSYQTTTIKWRFPVVQGASEAAIAIVEHMKNGNDNRYAAEAYAAHLDAIARQQGLLSQLQMRGFR
jgi:hypothetical protein